MNEIPEPDNVESQSYLAQYKYEVARYTELEQPNGQTAATVPRGACSAATRIPSGGPTVRSATARSGAASWRWASSSA